jgi:gas vesicle protein
LDEARIRAELVSGAIVDVDPLDETIIDVLPMDEMVTHEALIGANVGSLAALLDRDVSEHLRTRWIEIQGRFVDDPRSAVQQADALVSEVVDKITQMFASEHNSLDSQWKQGNDVSTEDLRKVLQHYRSFFNRLVV